MKTGALKAPALTDIYKVTRDRDVLMVVRSGATLHP